MNKEFLQKRLTEIDASLVQTQQQFQVMMGQKSELNYLIDQLAQIDQRDQIEIKDEEPCQA